MQMQILTSVNLETLCDLGPSISYVLSISTDLGNNVCSQYKVEKAVCPPKLRGGLFTTTAVDNIDLSPSSTSARDSFHGIGLSLFQHSGCEFSGHEQAMAISEDAEVAPKRTATPLHQCASCCYLQTTTPSTKVGWTKQNSHLIPQAI